MDIYAKLGQLKSIQENFDIFYCGWMENKCREYDTNFLSAYYDVYFSRYVTYNAIYNTLTNTLEQFEVLSRKKDKTGKEIDRGDKIKAIDIMSKYIQNTNLLIFFSHPEVVEDIKLIVEIIENKEFGIIYKYGEPQPLEDERLKVQLSNTAEKIKIKAILTLLYSIRCNMFHGSKNFEESQKQILKPLNRLLLNVVKISNEEFRHQIKILEEKYLKS